MKNVLPHSSEAPDASSKRLCHTCRRHRSAESFYEGCSECKTCKRARSKRNRALQARKLAAFERFVDALITLADQEPGEPAARTRSNAA
jgi:hypothetical protein